MDLRCEDCLDPTTGLASLNGEVDLIFADPPYFLSNGGTTCASGKRVSVDKGSWDRSRGLEADLAFHLAWLTACKRALKPSGTIWVSGTHHVIFSVGYAMQKLGFHVLNTVTWFKPNATPNLACRSLTHSTEFVIWAAPERQTSLSHTFNYRALKAENGGKQMRDMWSIPTAPKSEKRSGRHPTQKPLALVERILRVASGPEALVADPFMGSGTTGVAALHLGRRFIGWENDLCMYRIAARRIEAERQKIGDNYLDESVKTVVRGKSNLSKDNNKNKCGGKYESKDENRETADETETETETETADETMERDEMANLPPEFAQRVGQSRTAGGGNFIQHGDYIFMVEKWFFQKIQEACIITEFLTIESRKKIVYEGHKAVDQAPNVPGSNCSTVANFDGAGKLSAEGNARAVVLGLFGFREGEVTDEVVARTLRQVCNESDPAMPIQPAAGMLIACSTYPKEIKSRKGDFITGLNWDCVAKPGSGLNGPTLVQARLDALKSGGRDAALKVALEQLALARGNGALVSVPAEPTHAPLSAPPALPTALPTAPPALPMKVIDPFAGWTIHPGDPEFYYQGSIVKSKADLLAAANKQA